ncbi:type III-A CRISPR-associated RAMP protein Csm4 [Candidatus Bipolaricaulota sp. J31]
MRVAVYKLRFPNGVHVGAYGIGTEGVRLTIPADTLFAALLSSWVSLGKDPKLWADQFPRTIDKEFTPADPPFLLTSAFPYFAESLILFPKPKDPVLNEKVPEEKRKEWKKLSFVSERCLNRLAEGAPPEKLLEEGKLICGKSVLVLADEHKDLDNLKIWEERKIPRVALDRISSISNLYQVGRVDFAEGCGLWFGVIWLDPDRSCDNFPFKEAFEVALKALSHSGIGGERTYGYGTFEYELLDEFKWHDPAPGSPALLLSRYVPRPDELPDVLRNTVGYSLEEVRGWTSSPHGQYRRRTITMLSEGSVLKATGKVMGHLVDVGPLDIDTKKPLLPHPVWRYGLAALWPLGGGG